MQQAQLVTAPSPESALDNGVGRPTKESVARRGSATPRTRNFILMSINPFSLFGLVAALDSRNIRAHLTDSVEDCAVCATVFSPRTCPAGHAAEITHATQRPMTAIEIVDQLVTTVHQSVSAGAQWSGGAGGREHSALIDENRRGVGVCAAVSRSSERTP